jgi:hypothetical protein
MKKNKGQERTICNLRVLLLPSGGFKYKALGAWAPTKNNSFTLIIVLILIFKPPWLCLIYTHHKFIFLLLKFSLIQFFNFYTLSLLILLFFFFLYFNSSKHQFLPSQPFFLSISLASICNLYKLLYIEFFLT